MMEFTKLQISSLIEACKSMKYKMIETINNPESFMNRESIICMQREIKDSIKEYDELINMLSEAWNNKEE